MLILSWEHFRFHHQDAIQHAPERWQIQVNKHFFLSDIQKWLGSPLLFPPPVRLYFTAGLPNDAITCNRKEKQKFPCAKCTVNAWLLSALLKITCLSGFSLPMNLWPCGFLTEVMKQRQVDNRKVRKKEKRESSNKEIRWPPPPPLPPGCYSSIFPPNHSQGEAYFSVEIWQITVSSSLHLWPF